MVFGAFFARSTAVEALSNRSLSPTATFIRVSIFVFTHMRLQCAVLKLKLSNSELPPSKFYEILSTALFWVTTQQAVPTPYRRFGTTIDPIFKGQESGPIVCTETSVWNCHYSLRNNPEERSSHLLRGGSLKSRIVYEILFINSVYLSKQRFDPLQGFYPHSTTQIRR